MTGSSATVRDRRQCRHLARPALLAATAVAAGACGGGGDGGATNPGSSGGTAPPPGVAGVRFAHAGDTAATATQGDTLALGATAYDAQGRALAGQAISYASANGTVASVDAEGRVAALAEGTSAVTATAAGKTATATVTVRGIRSVALYPTAFALQAGTSARAALWAVARAPDGTRVPVTSASFRSGDPSVATVDPVTGLVTPVGVGTATLVATLNGRTTAASTLTVTASPWAVAYPITLRFVGNFAPAMQAAARHAADRWQRVLAGAPGTFHVAVPAGACFRGAPADTEEVAGATVFVVADSLPGAMVASAGGCVVRDPAPGAPTAFGPTALGTIRVDSARTRAFAASADAAGSAAEELIVHELGHVWGVGILWVAGAITPPVVTPSATDPRYVGAAGVAAAAALGIPAPGGVAVQATGGTGTAGTHWRAGDGALALGGEVLTPYVGAGMRLSGLTVAAVADLGYAVDPSAADVATCAALAPDVCGPLDPRTPNRTAGVSANRGAADAARVPLREVVEGPRFVVDRTGRLRRVAVRAIPARADVDPSDPTLVAAAPGIAPRRSASARSNAAP